MAKVLFGPIVSEARNKQGNLVFSRGRYGAYTRGWIMPDETATTPRTTVWQRFSAALTAWAQSISEAQRRAWAAYAKLLDYTDRYANRKNHPGRTPFLQQFLYLDNLSLPTLTDPPNSTRRHELASATLSLNTDNLELPLTLTYPPGQDQPPVIIYATDPLNPPRISGLGRFKQIAALPDDATYPYNLWSAYVAVYGLPPAGKKIILRARPIHPTTGLAGVPLLCAATDAGTGEPMLQTTLNLTSAQILALFTTPVQILPAPGAALTIVPHLAAIYYNYNTTQYTIGSGSTLRIVSSNDKTPRYQTRALAGVIDQVKNRMATTTPATNDVDVNDVENLPFYVRCSVQNPTLGDGTMRVILYYTIAQRT